jgi:hypothetical protein
MNLGFSRDAPSTVEGMQAYKMKFIYRLEGPCLALVKRHSRIGQ